MKKSIINIVLFFSLCFGIKSQAQMLVTEYKDKLSSLPEIHGKLLDNLINGAPSSIYVSNDNIAALFQQQEQYYPRMMFVTKPSDLNLLAQSYPSHIARIEVINILWNGSDVFEISSDLAVKLSDSNLQFIYIQSNQNLSKQLIENHFQQLIGQVDSLNGDVEILYSVIKQEQ